MTTRERTAAHPPVEQDGAARSLALHLLPGVATAALFFACGSVVTGAGYPRDRPGRRHRRGPTW